MAELGNVHIYGVEWDWENGNSSRGVRTDDAAGFSDPNPAVNNGTGSSPFDNLMPWAGMVKRVRSAGVMVKEPKYWFKWSKTGGKLKLQIADGPVEGFHVDPVNMDRGDGLGELNYSYIGRYHCSIDTYKSESNKKPAQNNLMDARTNVNAIGEHIYLFDFAQFWYIGMLYLVEYADWSGQKCVGYGCAEQGSNRRIDNGITDFMNYHTGTTAITRDTYGYVQYRNIENHWSNGYVYVDGCYYNNDGFHAILSPNDYSNNINGILLGKPLGGWSSDFIIPTESGFEWALVQSRANGSATTYATDSWNPHYENNNLIYVIHGGPYGTLHQVYGPFHLNYSRTTSVNYAYRLQERPPKTEKEYFDGLQEITLEPNTGFEESYYLIGDSKLKSFILKSDNVYTFSLESPILLSTENTGTKNRVELHVKAYGAKEKVYYFGDYAFVPKIELFSNDMVEIEDMNAYYLSPKFSVTPDVGSFTGDIIVTLNDKLTLNLTQDYGASIQKIDSESTSEYGVYQLNVIVPLNKEQLGLKVDTDSIVIEVYTFNHSSCYNSIQVSHYSKWTHITICPESLSIEIDDLTNIIPYFKIGFQPDKGTPAKIQYRFDGRSTWHDMAFTYTSIPAESGSGYFYNYRITASSAIPKSLLTSEGGLTEGTEGASTIYFRFTNSLDPDVWFGRTCEYIVNYKPDPLKNLTVEVVDMTPDVVFSSDFHPYVKVRFSPRSIYEKNVNDTNSGPANIKSFLWKENEADTWNECPNFVTEILEAESTTDYVTILVTATEGITVSANRFNLYLGIRLQNNETIYSLNRNDIWDYYSIYGSSDYPPSITYSATQTVDGAAVSSSNEPPIENYKPEFRINMLATVYNVNGFEKFGKVVKAEVGYISHYNDEYGFEWIRQTPDVWAQLCPTGEVSYIDASTQLPMYATSRGTQIIKASRFYNGENELGIARCVMGRYAYNQVIIKVYHSDKPDVVASEIAIDLDINNPWQTA